MCTNFFQVHILGTGALSILFQIIFEMLRCSVSEIHGKNSLMWKPCCLFELVESLMFVSFTLLLWFSRRMFTSWLFVQTIFIVVISEYVKIKKENQLLTEDCTDYSQFWPFTASIRLELATESAKFLHDGRKMSIQQQCFHHISKANTINHMLLIVANIFTFLITRKMQSNS